MEKRIFVGRKDELKEFEKGMKDPRGQAILVVGNRGMGKTWLVNEMVERAEAGSDGKCFWLRYEVTPTDPANNLMAEIMNDAADAIDSLRGRARKLMGRNKQKFAALFGVCDVVPVVGTRIKAIGDLMMSLTNTEGGLSRVSGGLMILSFLALFSRNSSTLCNWFHC